MVHWYYKGDCYAFAAALAQYLGLKTVRVWGTRDYYKAVHSHAFVKYRGNYYDWSGRTTLARIEEESGKRDKGEITIKLCDFIKNYTAEEAVRKATSILSKSGICRRN